MSTGIVIWDCGGATDTISDCVLITNAYYSRRFVHYCKPAFIYIPVWMNTICQGSLLWWERWLGEQMSASEQCENIYLNINE